MRIRVLVVEDEPPIQRAIIQCIEQQSGCFEVVGTAINGRQALEKLPLCAPDAVFTDIRMPVMDGLEMARRIKEQAPGVEVIIISGYQDFEYMRGALVAHAADYLLKPVTPDSMAPVLAALRSRCAERRAAERRALMETLLSGQQTAIPPQYRGENDTVFALCAGPYPLAEDTLLPGQAFWRENPLAEQIAPLLQQGEDCVCMAGKRLAEMTVLARFSAPARAGVVARQLWEQLNRGAPLPVSLVWMPGAVPIEQVGAADQRLRRRMHTQLRLFEPQLLCDTDPPAPELEPRFAAGYERSLNDARRAQDPAALQTAAQACVHGFVQARAAQIHLVHFLESVINGSANLFDPETADHKLALRAAVSNATTEISLANDLAYLLSALFENSAPAEGEPPVIAQIERYLNENFNQSVTSAALSEKFGFVPSYISKLFRTWRGLSPSEYLTRLRVERAKQIFADTPGLLVKEVAPQVGFSDPYYFSKIFKKETGRWPSEYEKK